MLPAILITSYSESENIFHLLYKAKLPQNSSQKLPCISWGSMLHLESSLTLQEPNALMNSAY